MFEEHLDVLLATTRAGAAVLVDGADSAARPAAERGLVFGTHHAARTIRERLLELAAQALATGEPAHYPTLGGELPGDVRDDLFSAAYASALIVPVALPGAPLGAIVLLFDAQARPDDETLPYVQTVAHLLALALRESRAAAAAPDSARTEDTTRMASLGLLTASVAHELRGPAGALILQLEEQRRILDQLQRLERTADGTAADLIGELTELTSDVEAAVLRIRDTTRQFSTLSRRETDFEELDLADVVRDALSVARPHLDQRGLVLVQELTPGAAVNGRRDNLAQLVLNLVFNAADACETAVTRPGRIVVRVSEATDLVVLEVIDSGPGVPAAALGSIFEPFFTTKQRGQGTGLGLKICSDVARAHGGRIEVDNQAAGGACFRVVLPRLEGASGVHPVHDPSPMPGLHRAVPRRSILVIDDDPVFSRTMRRTLKSHDVKTASTASEAEMALLDPSYEPDLVLCDVYLPGTNGDVLHSRITALRPRLSSRFVFVTGGGLGDRETEYMARAGCRTLLKPVDTQELMRALSDPPAPEEPDALRRAAGSRPPRTR